MNNLLYLISYLAIGASLLLAFLLITNPQKVNRKANVWFGCFILGIFVLLFADVLRSLEIHPINPLFAFIINFPNYIIAPIFYLSVNYYIHPTEKWKNKNILLFSFGFVMIFLLIFTNLLYPAEEDEDNTRQMIALIFNVVFSLQLVPFFYFSYRKIIKHQKNVRLFASTLETVDLKWLEYMIKGVVMMVIFWICDILLQLTQVSKLFNVISNFIYLVGFFFIAYHSMKQKEIYPYNEEEKEEIEEIITETDIPAENRRKLLPDEKLEEEKNTLVNVMETDKPFLDCELSLVKLASLMNVSTHVLSYIINNGFDENFYQFVNRYRIEEAKKLLLNPKMDHYNLIGIAYEVGFNSKTVFNTTFKKYTEKNAKRVQKNYAFGIRKRI